MQTLTAVFAARDAREFGATRKRVIPRRTAVLASLLLAFTDGEAKAFAESLPCPSRHRLVGIR